MIKAILNYPTPSKKVHRNTNCGFAPTDVDNDRYIIVTHGNIGSVISNMYQIVFRAEAGFNNLHFEINFNNEEFELAVLKYLCSIIELRYNPFRNLPIVTHC